MINANDLYNKQKEKEKDKYKIYDKIYELIEKKICSSSSCNYYYTIYEVPEFLVGYTLYSFDDCCKYIQKKLKNNNFKVQFYEPTTLFISWDSI